MKYRFIKGTYNDNIIYDTIDDIHYVVLDEDNSYILIRNNFKKGIFNKITQEYILQPIFDTIDFKLPHNNPDIKILPREPNFLIIKDNHIGIASIYKGVLLNPIIPKDKFRVYPEPYSNNIVVVECIKGNGATSICPKMQFLNVNNWELSPFTFSQVRSAFNNGRASVYSGRSILEVDDNFNILDSYNSSFIGFNDELYTL